MARYQVSLASVGNPDYGQDPDRPLPGVPPQLVSVPDVTAASRACRAYIAAHDLGSGNWAGGNVYEGGVAVAYVSYNGRVWGPGGVEILVSNGRVN
jgi:hypothetical protein